MAFDEEEAEKSNDFVEGINTKSKRDFDKDVEKMRRGYIAYYSANPELLSINPAVQTVIRQSGYGTTSQALLNEGFDSVVEESFDLYKRMLGQTFQFSNESLDRLGVWKDQSLLRFEKLISGSTDDVTNLLVNAVTTNNPDSQPRTWEGLAVDYLGR